MARRILGSAPSGPRLWVGGALVGMLALAALLAPALAPFDPEATPAGPGATSLRAPRAPFHLGTDLLGRDLFSRILYGSRVSLVVGVGAEVIAVPFGLLVGGLAGYFGGWLDRLLTRVTETVAAFPGLVLAIGLMGVFGPPGLDKVILVLALIGWTPVARIVRGEVRAFTRAEAIVAARAIGAGEASLVRRHLLPHLRAPLLGVATVGVASNIAAEAGLSFLGLGVQPPAISWGTMLAEGQAFLTASPWVVVFPGLALTLMILGVNLVGDGLRERLALRVPDRL